MVFLSAIIVFGGAVGGGILSGGQEVLAITTAVGSGAGLLISAVAVLLVLFPVPEIVFWVLVQDETKELSSPDSSS